MSNSEYLQGLQNIERKITNDLKIRNIDLSSTNFLWNNGKALNLSQDSIDLEIAIEGKTLKAKFTREQLEDSWQQITRADVRACISHIALNLTN